MNSAANYAIYYEFYVLKNATFLETYIVALIHKTKGDIQNCANYRRIEVISHTVIISFARLTHLRLWAQ